MAKETSEKFIWRTRPEGKTPVEPLVMGCGEKILTFADLKLGTRIIVQQRSRRIQTRTKGKRKMKRLIKEYHSANGRTNIENFL